VVAEPRHLVDGSRAPDPFRREPQRQADDAIHTAAKVGDADTSDLFTEVSRGLDKLLWFVEAQAQAKA